MKATALVAIVGVVAVLGLAGAALAAGPLQDSASGSSTTRGTGSGHMDGMGPMHGQLCDGVCGNCPVDNDWNYSWNYSQSYSWDGGARHGYCPCMG